MRKIHASLTGTDVDGTVCRLDEPGQLLWVHCAEVDSYCYLPPLRPARKPNA